MQTVQP